MWNISVVRRVCSLIDILLTLIPECVRCVREVQPFLRRQNALILPHPRPDNSVEHPTATSVRSRDIRLTLARRAIGHSADAPRGMVQ